MFRFSLLSRWISDSCAFNLPRSHKEAYLQGADNHYWSILIHMCLPWHFWLLLFQSLCSVMEQRNPCPPATPIQHLRSSTEKDGAKRVSTTAEPCREWTLYRYRFGDGKVPWDGSATLLRTQIITVTCHVIKLFVRCFNRSKTPQRYLQHICLDIVSILFCTFNQ